jgi:hypothetical protein
MRGQARGLQGRRSQRERMLAGELYIADDPGWPPTTSGPYSVSC